MSSAANWSVDYYKTEYESEEHWELRKKFMEMHKDKFSEDELVCLAQVFTNVEFMGCKYPDETMRMVGELSQEVASDFRKDRASRLKRTFVKASDAAEQRAKGRRVENTKESNTFTIRTVLSATKISYDSDDENNQRPCFGNSNLTNEKHLGLGFNSFKPFEESNNSGINNKQCYGRNLPSGNNMFSSLSFNANNEGNSSHQVTDLFSGNFPYGKFVLFLIGDRNCLSLSAQKCNAVVNERESLLGEEKQVEILVNGKVAGISKSATSKEAKSHAFDAAIKKLKQECYSIKPNPNPDRIDIRKDNQTIVANLKTFNERKLDSNNIGYKMMQKLGWSGGGLGSKTQGRENPVDFLVKNNRRGLGNNSDEINGKYFRTLLLNYIKSDDIRDLYFESGFTKEERATLHQIASSKNLKSSSHGKEPNRHLIISKKTITPTQILQEILINQNPIYMNKYEVKVPRCKSNEFPDHMKFKS